VTIGANPALAKVEPRSRPYGLRSGLKRIKRIKKNKDKEYNKNNRKDK
jgi:hypothetical protein